MASSSSARLRTTSALQIKPSTMLLYEIEADGRVLLSADAFARLLQVHNLQFENDDRIRQSLGALRRGADLFDEWLIAMSRCQECREFATFDTAIAKRHAKFAFVPKD